MNTQNCFKLGSFGIISNNYWNSTKPLLPNINLNPCFDKRWRYKDFFVRPNEGSLNWKFSKWFVK